MAPPRELVRLRMERSVATTAIHRHILGSAAWAILCTAVSGEGMGACMEAWVEPGEYMEEWDRLA